MALNPQQMIEKIAARFGFVRKSWYSAWLQSREFNLLQGGTKVTAPYSQHADVYKSIKAIADNVGQAEFKIMRGEKEAPPSQLNALFNRPNPLLSRSQLWEATAMYLSLCGNCFWMFGQSVGQAAGTSKLPAEIWVFNPIHFSPQCDSAGNLLYWKYRGQFVIKPEDVIHFKYFNPYDQIMGLAPMDPIASTVNLDYQSMIFNSKFFENNAEPGYVLSTDQPLSDEQFNRLKTQWDAQHKGINNSHKIAILEGGLKPASVGSSHKDMDFIEQRRFNRENIMGIWRVPKAMFSITEDLNYATFQGQKKLFWTETIMPVLRYVEEILNAHFFPRYAPGLAGKFDFSNIASLQDDMTLKIDRATKMFAMGVPFNVINDELELGFPKIEGGDIGYLPFNLVPSNEPRTPAPAANPVLPPTDPVKEPPAAPTDAAAPVKAKKDVDREAVSKRFISIQDPLEKRYEAVVKDFFFKQRAKLLAKIGKAKELKIHFDINIDWSNEDSNLIKISGPIFGESVKQGADFANSLLGGTIDFGLLNPSLSSVVQSRFEKLPEINNTIRAELQSQLNEGLLAGETTDQIADRIRSIYNVASNRSKIIARTEITGAMNSGTIVAFKQAGVTKKQWTTSHDDRVRESHMAIDGEIVGIDQVFSNGVDYPGGHGPAEEVINCRCNPTPVLD